MSRDIPVTGYTPLMNLYEKKHCVAICFSDSVYTFHKSYNCTWVVTLRARSSRKPAARQNQAVPPTDTVVKQTPMLPVRTASVNHLSIFPTSPNTWSSRHFTRDRTKMFYKIPFSVLVLLLELMFVGANSPSQDSTCETCLSKDRDLMPGVGFDLTATYGYVYSRLYMSSPELRVR